MVIKAADHVDKGDQAEVLDQQAEHQLVVMMVAIETQVKLMEEVFLVVVVEEQEQEQDQLDQQVEQLEKLHQQFRQLKTLG